MAHLTVHCFDGFTRKYYRFSDFVESCAASAMPLGWEYDEFDREFQDQCDRYSTVEMYSGDDDYIEVVTLDGKPIGVIDRADIGLGDLDRFETFEQQQLREGAENAARELHAESYAELRRAAE